MTRPFQIIVCVGPRCSARGNPERLHAHARGREKPLEGKLYLGTYDCLSRCPAGPNVLVRTLDDPGIPDERPGLSALNGDCYFRVDRDLLDRIIDTHASGKGPIPGRSGRY